MSSEIINLGIEIKRRLHPGHYKKEVNLQTKPFTTDWVNVLNSRQPINYLLYLFSFKVAKDWINLNLKRVENSWRKLDLFGSSFAAFRICEPRVVVSYFIYKVCTTMFLLWYIFLNFCTKIIGRSHQILTLKFKYVYPIRKIVCTIVLRQKNS